MRAEIANGPYGRMIARVRDYHFIVSDIRAAFHHGLQRENVVARRCSQCRISHGLEFWVCPMCHRRWNEYHDRPRWLTWKCPDCHKWWCDEFRWCCTNGCSYRRDPDPHYAHVAASQERRANPTNVFFDDRNVPPRDQAEVLYRVPPLDERPEPRAEPHGGREGSLGLHSRIGKLYIIRAR